MYIDRDPYRRVGTVVGIQRFDGKKIFILCWSRKIPAYLQAHRSDEISSDIREQSLRGRMAIASHSYSREAVAR